MIEAQICKFCQNTKTCCRDGTYDWFGERFCTRFCPLEGAVCHECNGMLDTYSTVVDDRYLLCHSCYASFFDTDDDLYSDDLYENAAGYVEVSDLLVELEGME